MIVTDVDPKLAVHRSNNQNIELNAVLRSTEFRPKLAVHRSNNQNRDATPGQKAMAFAMAFPTGLPRGRDKCSQIREHLSKTQENYISQARYVLRHTPTAEGQPYPQRCLDVMAGLLTLTEAYDLTQMEVKRQSKDDRLRKMATGSPSLKTQTGVFNQSKDDRLRKMATRIQARAIARCGELLREIEARQGANQNIQDGTVPKVFTRTDAATQAGLSERQRKTALHVDAGFKSAFFGPFKGGRGQGTS